MTSRRPSPQNLRKASRQPNRIGELRMERGWNQSDLSERTGLGVSTISRLENGGQDLDVDKMRVIAAAFGVRMFDLVRDPVPMAPIEGEVGPDGVVAPRDASAPAEYTEIPGHMAVGRTAVVRVGPGAGINAPVGWLLFYERAAATPVPDEALKAECVVRLADGQTMVRTVVRSQAPDRYTLVGGGKIVEGVAIAWAAPIRAWLSPRLVAA